jgi:hypothetical protein
VYELASALVGCNFPELDFGLGASRSNAASSMRSSNTRRVSLELTGRRSGPHRIARRDRIQLELAFMNEDDQKQNAACQRPEFESRKPSRYL